MDTAQLPAFLAGLGIGLSACGGLIVALRVQRAAYLDLRDRVRDAEQEARERLRFALTAGALSANEARQITGSTVTREPTQAEREWMRLPEQTTLSGGAETLAAVPNGGVVTLDDMRRAALASGAMNGRHGDDTN